MTDDNIFYHFGNVCNRFVCVSSKTRLILMAIVKGVAMDAAVPTPLTGAEIKSQCHPVLDFSLQGVHPHVCSPTSLTA